MSDNNNNMNNNSIILKSFYECSDIKDPNILTFGQDEYFVLIKEQETSDWYYVVNSEGKIGYVPNSYVTFDHVR